MFGFKISPWRVVLGFLDALVIAILLAVAALAYFNGHIPAQAWDALLKTAPIAAGLLIIANWLLGLYNRVWQYATAETAVSIAASVTASQMLAAAIGKFVLHEPLPVGVWMTVWFGGLIGVGGVRFWWRLVRPYLQKAQILAGAAPKRVLIYGAGLHGDMLARQFRENGNGRYEFVGFVDDALEKGSIVGFGRVLGQGKDLPRIVAEYEVDEVIVAIPSAGREKIRQIHEICKNAGVAVRVLPHILEIIEESGERRLRPINVEDLIGRSLAIEDIELHRNYIAGKTVLITGAGGSIGRELAKQVCRYGPKHVILLGRGENRIHWVYWRLQELYPDVELTPLVANVVITSSVERALRLFKPEVIIHAAAHKHVYLMEYVPAEAVRNNVIGTARLADLAERYGVERFIFISTDKAAAPENVMGATKRMAELLLTRRPYRGTSFICVRFGNVLGSEGSVLEIFKRQWEEGRPLTVTHPEATRFFMTIPEACFLVLQAGALGKHGDIFLLDMGEPIRIMDLAREFIALQGGDPNAPEAIKITGLRPGEKLHEVLTNPNEVIEPTEDEHIGRVLVKGELPDWEQVLEYLRQLEECVEEEDDEGVCRILNEATGAKLRAENCLSVQWDLAGGEGE